MVHETTLQALTDTTISAVKLYSGQTDITRVVNVPLKSGHSRVTIQGLPNLLQNTVRVEGHGKATILDVAFSNIQVIQKVLPDSDPLKLKHAEIVKAHQSAIQARQTLSTYLGSATVKDVNAFELEQLLDEYAKLTAKADRRILDIDKELADIDKGIAAAEKPDNKSGTKQVSILLVGDTDEEVKLFLKYAVRNADWSASYDIRVDTRSTKENITITYKALIAQTTGESWDQVPLTLETVAPASGSPPTTIQPWNISVHTPIVWRSRGSHGTMRSRGLSESPEEAMEETQAVVVSEKTGISATYQIPGLVDIPSDGAKHYVTIAKLQFTAKMLWYSIPKVDTRTYLKTSIKNESDYSFVPGNANVFVDGSFVASVSVPSASPQEVFDCPLGMDPSVRITYHPCEKKASQSGFIAKTSTTSYIQRITVQNTKSIDIEALRIIDNIPVSQDERIQVKLISPLLAPPGQPASRKRIMAASGVSVQWHGADDDNALESTVGKDGKLNWILKVPPMNAVHLSMQFEVTAPPDINVQGMY